jgi:hypothetical protein
MESSVQFDTVMRLPHRRHAFGVNAPALFRHIGFRIEEQDDNPLTAIDSAISVSRRDKLITRVNEALKYLQEETHTDDLYSFCLSTEGRENNRLLVSETLLIDLKTPPKTLSGWRSRLRLDMYDEYYFVTLILDQKDSNDRALHICQIEQRLCSGKKQKVSNARFLQTYYHTIWFTLDKFIGEGLRKFPGKRFTEFRGIALRELTNPFRQSGTAGGTHKIHSVDESLGCKSRNLLRAWVTSNDTFVSEVLQLKQSTGAAERDANCVLSELLDGGAIYLSSVRQAPTPATTPPLRYFILYNGLSKYQLGRLIRRTHVLGELRCAAVLDMELLEEASNGIRSLGNHIDDLLGKKNKSASLTDDELRSVQESLNKLASSKIPGGLLYRVNRSRYYATNFQERIKEMRVRPLEGWQSYSEFFRRNLYPQFDLIDQIGKRYEVLAERVNRLTNARNAEKLNEFENNSLKLVRQMNDFNATMLRIQDLGEWIALTAFTYYGGHIVATLFRAPEFLGLCSIPPDFIARICLGWTGLSPEFFVFLGMMTAFTIAVGLKMWWPKRWQRREEEARQSAVAVDKRHLPMPHRRAAPTPYGPGNSSADRPANR